MCGQLRQGSVVKFERLSGATKKEAREQVRKGGWASKKSLGKKGFDEQARKGLVGNYAKTDWQPRTGGVD